MIARASLLIEVGRLDEAEGILGRFVAGPASGVALRLLAFVALGRGELNEVLDRVRGSLRADPHDDQAMRRPWSALAG